MKRILALLVFLFFFSSCAQVRSRVSHSLSQPIKEVSIAFPSLESPGYPLINNKEVYSTVVSLLEEGLAARNVRVVSSSPLSFTFTLEVRDKFLTERGGVIYPDWYHDPFWSDDEVVIQVRDVRFTLTLKNRESGEIEGSAQSELPLRPSAGERERLSLLVNAALDRLVVDARGAAPERLLRSTSQ